MEASKESTARVQLYKEMGIPKSYTLESTFCGMNAGKKQGFQIQIADLDKLGHDFAKTLNVLCMESTESISKAEIFPPKMKNMSKKKIVASRLKSKSTAVNSTNEDRMSDEISTSSEEER